MSVVSNPSTTPNAARDAGQTAKAYQFLLSLTPEEIAYAANPARGEYQGFAALHDLFDANEAVAAAVGDPDGSPKWFERANAFTSAVTKILVELPGVGSVAQITGVAIKGFKLTLR